MPGTHTSKLSALRSKTDRQLVELISRTLDHGLELAGNAGLRMRAERAFCEARRLLPLLPYLDRRGLETKFNQLAEILYPAEQAACF